MRVCHCAPPRDARARSVRRRCDCRRYASRPASRRFRRSCRCETSACPVPRRARRCEPNPRHRCLPLRVDDQSHRRGEFRQEVPDLVVIERRVVHIVDVEAQLVLDPLASERVKTVGVRHQLLPDRHLLFDRERFVCTGILRRPVKRTRCDRWPIAAIHHDVDRTRSRKRAIGQQADRGRHAGTAR